MKPKIGDVVGYKSVLTDMGFFHVGKVYDIWENGIPSCREPMLKIAGKAGCVLASHCTVLCPDCQCEIKEIRDTTSCWCDVTVKAAV